MTEDAPLPALLSAMAQEAQTLAEDLRDIETALLPSLLPALATQPALGAALQRFDPVLQRLDALSRIALVAASEAPSHPMPATSARLRKERLAVLFPALQGAPQPPPSAGSVTLFDIDP